jgi:hypothetical protein
VGGWKGDGDVIQSAEIHCKTQADAPVFDFMGLLSRCLGKSFVWRFGAFEKM